MREPAPHSIYSIEQAESWLEHIGLPKDLRPQSLRGKDLETLALVQRHHLSKVPFENIEIHYSDHHSITLDPLKLYDRVIKRGHGGYCMQGNTFFEHMLRAIGFTVFSAGARSRPRVNGIPTGPWAGWTHQVIIATLSDGHKYLVDVAYGGDCPIQPMKLEEGIVSKNIGQCNRLVQEALGFDPSQKTWVYQIQYEPDGDWHGAFCFCETEFLPQDFGVMNYFTSTNSSSWLSTTVMGVLFIREGEEMVGKYTLANNIIKKNVRGNVEIVLDCRDEKERVDGMEKYFGIVLNDEERAAIQGWKSELKNV